VLKVHRKSTSTTTELLDSARAFLILDAVEMETNLTGSNKFASVHVIFLISRFIHSPTECESFCITMGNAKPDGNGSVPVPTSQEPLDYEI
jgi:hypothetical protein